MRLGRGSWRTRRPRQRRVIIRFSKIMLIVSARVRQRLRNSVRRRAKPRVMRQEKCLQHTTSGAKHRTRWAPSLRICQGFLKAYEWRTSLDTARKGGVRRAMKKSILFLFVALCAGGPLDGVPAFAPTGLQARTLKVFISVDMEGISGVVATDQTSASGADYNRFRRLMTEEANAAIDGAVAAGATEIVVNDAHGSMRNLLIEELHAPAELISNSIKPMGMMQGLDSTFDAVMFIGYHAKAGSPVGVLAHTGSGTIADLRITGRSMSEGGMNALVAGALGVPVVLITGDQAAIAQMRELVPAIEAVQVKEAIGTTAARSLRPEEARARIRAAAERALRRLSEIKPLRPALPATFEVAFTQTALADVAEQIPTIQRVDAHTVRFQTEDFLQGYRLVRLLYRFLRVD